MRVRATTAAVEKQYAIRILCVCVFVALVIRHTMRHIVISGLPRSTVFLLIS